MSNTTKTAGQTAFIPQGLSYNRLLDMSEFMNLDCLEDFISEFMYGNTHLIGTSDLDESELNLTLPELQTLLIESIGDTVFIEDTKALIGMFHLNEIVKKEYFRIWENKVLEFEAGEDDGDGGQYDQYRRVDER